MFSPPRGLDGLFDVRVDGQAAAAMSLPGRPAPALGNGYLATRGARSEAADDGTHYPGAYLAGVYNRLRTDMEGRPVEHESIVNAPSWLPLTFSVCGDPWLGEPGATICGEELRLDLRAGVLLRRFTVTDPAGRRTCVTERRLVSMADPHLAAIGVELVAENWAGTLRVRSGIDGTCCADQTTEARLLSHCHLALAGSGADPPGVVWLAARTTQSGVVIAEAARTRVTAAAGPPRFSRGLLADTLGRAGIGEAELARFEEVSRGLYVPFHDGVISQFAGYERLDPIDLAAYRARYGNIGRLDLILEAEGDSVRRYQVAKQADTLMLFYLFPPAELRETFARLGYQLTDATIRRAARYYSARVTHGSTLSRVVHAWVAARGDRRASWRHFTEALAADMADTQGGTTGEGIHLGAMAGTIDLLQRCYTGLQARDGTLAFDPALPGELASLRLALAYRGHRLDVRIGHDEITVASAPGDAVPVTLSLAGQQVRLRPGGRVRHRLPARPGAVTARQGASSRPPAARRPGPGEGPIAPAADPVCGMIVEESAGASITRQGWSYFFCSRACRELFLANPEQYLPASGPAASTVAVPRGECCGR